MLTITPEAAQAIREVLAAPDAPGSYLRISLEAGQSDLAISIVQAPEDDDQVVSEDEVDVCIEPTLTEMLDDKELDATVDDGQINFSIGPQAGSADSTPPIEPEEEGPMSGTQVPGEF